MIWNIIALIASAIFFISAIVFSEENGKTLIFPPLVYLVLCAAGLYFFNKTLIAEIPQQIASNWQYALLGAFVYLFIGLVWSFFKWLQFLKLSKICQLADKRGTSEIPFRIPKASENISQISAWILYWPLSVLRYLLANALADLMNFIVKSFGRFYDKLAENIFK